MRFVMYAKMMGYEFVLWDDFEEDERMSVPLPCSCGADAHIVYLGLNFGYVECLKCELKTDDKQMDEAIEDWNKRVNE